MSSLSLAIFTIAFILLGHEVESSGDSHGTHWGYIGANDAAHWPKLFPACSGSKQSPIDIDPDAATPEKFDPIYLKYDVNIKKAQITDNGHTALLTIHESDATPYVSEGGLLNKYNFVQVHFHWGNDSTRGSEHRIKSKKYPGELHLVHYNSKYNSFENATGHPDGLAVVGVFLQAAPQNNTALNSIINALSTIKESGDEADIKDSFSLKDLIPSSTSKFYRYSGSLTTPNCDEIVTWTVFDNPIFIGEKQLAVFRQLRTEDGMLIDNFRPPQPLKGRTVHVRSSSTQITLSMDLMMVLVFSAFSL